MKTQYIIMQVCMVLLMLCSLSFAADEVMFNYEGRVRVHGQPFNGTGNFKFAIVNPSGHRCSPGKIILQCND